MNNDKQSNYETMVADIGRIAAVLQCDIAILGADVDYGTPMVSLGDTPCETMFAATNMRSYWYEIKSVSRYLRRYPNGY